MKNTYRGYFNFRREVKILYCKAYSPKQARIIMCGRIAKQHDLSPFQILSYFPEGALNHEIQLETEWTEVSQIAE